MSRCWPTHGTIARMPLHRWRPRSGWAACSSAGRSGGTAIVLTAFLVVVAVRIVASSASELIDRAPDASVLACIEEVVSRTQGVKSYHGFRARQVGGKVAMDIHIQVDPALTVRQGHDIASTVRRRIFESDSRVIEVVVHIEPKEQPLP